MDENLKKLLEIEKVLISELEQNPVFIKLESLRSTISSFQNGHSETGAQSTLRPIIPSSYDNELTWNQKILFIVNKQKNAFVSDIVAEMIKLGAKQDKIFLTKRVSVLASNMKKKKILGAKAVGKKFKFFIK